jgi:hypothetical protein
MRHVPRAALTARQTSKPHRRALLLVSYATYCPLYWRRRAQQAELSVGLTYRSNELFLLFR